MKLIIKNTIKIGNYKITKGISFQSGRNMNVETQEGWSKKGGSYI